MTELVQTTPMSAWPSPPRRRRLLGRRRAAILRAVAETIFWDGTQPVPPERLDWLAVEIDDYLGATTGVTRTVVYIALWILQFSPIFTGVRLALFTGSTVPQRLKAFQRLEHSPLFFSSVVATLTKALLCTLYFEHPAANAETGYDGEAKIGKRPDTLPPGAT